MSVRPRTGQPNPARGGDGRVRRWSESKVPRPGVRRVRAAGSLTYYPILDHGYTTPLFNTLSGSNYTQAATTYAVNTSQTDYLAATWPDATILIGLGITWFVDSASGVFDSGTKNAVGYGAGTPSVPGMTHLGTLQWETEATGVDDFASGYTIAAGFWWAELGAMTTVDVSDVTGVTACLNQEYIVTNGTSLLLRDTHQMGTEVESDVLTVDTAGFQGDGIPGDYDWSMASYGGVPVAMRDVLATTTLAGPWAPVWGQLPIAWIRAYLV